MSSLLTHVMLMNLAQQPSVYDPDAQALFDRMPVQPSTTEKNAINTLILALKTPGYFARMDKLLVPRYAVDVSAAVLDWKGGSSATLHGSATWDPAYGFVGSTNAKSYINSRYNPAYATNFSLDSFSVGSFVTAAGTGDSDFLFGTRGSTGPSLTLFESTSNSYEAYACATTNTYTAGSQVGTGLIVLQRTASNAVEIYKNGTSIATNSAVSVSIPLYGLYICGNNVYGTASAGSTTKIGAWWAGDSFTPVEQAAIKSAFETYFNALAVDPDAQALFDRMIYAAPSSTWKGKINDFIITGKNESIYQGFDCLLIPKGMQDEYSGLLDWMTANSAVKQPASTWDTSLGYNAPTVFSTNGYIDTLFTPNAFTNYQPNSCSIGVYLTNIPPMSNQYSSLFGAQGPGQADIFLDINRYDNQGVYNARLHSGFIDEDYVYHPMNTGLVIMSRVSSTVWKLYQDGVEIGTATASVVGVPTVSIYLFANHGGEDYAQNLSIGAFFAGAYIDPSKHLVLKTMFDTLWA